MASLATGYGVGTSAPKRPRTEPEGAAYASALVVIDMQNDFCLPGRALCVQGALGCLPKVDQAVNSARAFGVPIFWVCREHDASGKLPHSVQERWPSNNLHPSGYTHVCLPQA